MGAPDRTGADLRDADLKQLLLDRRGHAISLFPLLADAV
jgi:hypothetical protein